MARNSKVIVNMTRSSVLCEPCVVAERPLRRMRGLLGRKALADGEGMLLRPAPSIHTAFMRFPIDVVFLDSELEVLKIVPELRPWRAAGLGEARAILELAAGESARRGVEVGDRLGVVETGSGSTVTMTDASLEAQDRRSEEAPAIARTKVLLAGEDRRFRSVTAALLTGRGCTVILDDSATDLADTATRERADVVVIDAGRMLTAGAREAARIERIDPPIGVVLVGDEPGDGLSTMTVFAKWGSFDDLFQAVEKSRPDGEHRSVFVG